MTIKYTNTDKTVIRLVPEGSVLIRESALRPVWAYMVDGLELDSVLSELIQSAAFTHESWNSATGRSMLDTHFEVTPATESTLTVDLSSWYSRNYGD